jgi:hypothetical protein
MDVNPDNTTLGLAARMRALINQLADNPDPDAVTLRAEAQRLLTRITNT